MKIQLTINEVEYVTGRDEGRMISVFFPVDCLKSCIFCTTKQYYKNPNKEAVRAKLYDIADSNIEEVVFTGGEPLADLQLLAEYLNIVKNKIVYINTCLDTPSDTIVEFINSYDCIKGVNISRHDLNNQGINFIKKILCNVRINIVGYSIEDIPKYVELWTNVKDNLEISLRENYQNITIANLYDFNTPTLKYLTTHYNFYSQVYCHVCNKYMFKTNKGLIIRYHRGLPNTRITIGNILEIQELVLFPDGKLCTDWDYTDNGIKEIGEYLKIKNI